MTFDASTTLAVAASATLDVNGFADLTGATRLGLPTSSSVTANSLWYNAGTLEFRDGTKTLQILDSDSVLDDIADGLLLRQ